MAFVTVTLPALSSSSRSLSDLSSSCCAVPFFIHQAVLSVLNSLRIWSCHYSFITETFPLTRKHRGRASIKEAQKCVEKHRKKQVVTLSTEPSVDLRALLMDPFSHLVLYSFACHAMLALINCKNCDCLSPFHHTSALQLQFTCIALHPSKGKVPRKEQARLQVNWSGCTENQKNQLWCPGMAGEISFERSCRGFTQCHCVTGAGLTLKVLKNPFAQVVLRPEFGHQAKAVSWAKQQ